MQKLPVLESEAPGNHTANDADDDGDRAILLYVHRSEVAYLGRGQGGKRARECEGSTADTTQKRPEGPWTAARTMEVLRRCPLAIAQRLVRCAIAVSTAVLGRVTRTMSVALLLRNNPKRKKFNFCSPAPPPCS